MPDIDVGALAGQMAAAAKGVLDEKWPEAKDYAEAEFKKIGEAMAFIGRQRVAGKMNDEQARLHLQLQKNSAKIVMLTIEGLGLLAVEQAINAALDVVKDTVNTALDFRLL